MQKSVTDLLKCPVCGSRMTTSEDGRSCFCFGERRHCYDLARSGYLNLNPPKGGAGDLRDAIRARTCFLEAGYYQPLAEKIEELLQRIPSSKVVDAGCGEGYYTNYFAKNRTVIGVDLSKNGIEAGAKSSVAKATNAAFVVASLFALPIQDQSVDVVVNIFAPCAEAEFCRVLKTDGHVLVVAAGERHLLGLKEQIYDNPYCNSGRADLPKNMICVERTKLSYPVTVRGQEHIQSLFSMTPYYWRTSLADRAKLERLEDLTTELDFDLFLFKKGI